MSLEAFLQIFQTQVQLTFPNIQVQLACNLSRSRPSGNSQLSTGSAFTVADEATQPLTYLLKVFAFPRFIYRHVILKSNVFLRLLNDSVHISTHNLTKVPWEKITLKSIKLRTVKWLPWFPQITILKYEDLASQPSEELAAIEEKFNISLTSKEVNTLIRSCDGGVITFGKDNGGNMSLSTIWPKYVPDAEVLVRSQQQFGQLGSH